MCQVKVINISASVCDIRFYMEDQIACHGNFVINDFLHVQVI